MTRLFTREIETEDFWGLGARRWGKGAEAALWAEDAGRTLEARPGRGAVRCRRQRGRRLERLPLARRYRPLGRVGEGAQGIAYVCADLRRPGDRVVIKLSRPEPYACAALADEVRVLRDLRDAPGVPRILGLLLRSGDLRGFVTPFFPGDTLDRLLFYGGIPRWEVLPVAISLCESVLGIHGRGYIHRDLKPENVLCGLDGRVQILDFGLARGYVGQFCENAISGTPAYASPEQIEGRTLDPRSDLFSLGLLLYELVTARSFFPQDAPTINEFLVARERRLAEPIGDLEVDERFSVLIRRLIVRDVELRAGPGEVRARVRELRQRCAA